MSNLLGTVTEETICELPFMDATKAVDEFELEQPLLLALIKQSFTDRESQKTVPESMVLAIVSTVYALLKRQCVKGIKG